MQTQRRKRTDMRNDAMCNVQQYKWTFETSSSTQHLSTWIRRVPTYVRGRGGGDLEYHSLAASCGAFHSEGTMASQAIESGQRRVVPVARAQHSESEHFESEKSESEQSESVGMRHLGAAPQVLAQGAAARWRLTGTARRAAPLAAWLGLSTQLVMGPPPAACAVPPSPCSAVPSMGKLHRGHTFFFFSHSSAQPEWKVCKHGSVRTCGIGGLHGSEVI